MRPGLPALVLAAWGLVLAAAGLAVAAPVSDVTQSLHNLSVGGPGGTRAQTESQVCVFCHTPHGATAVPGAPLWNRQLSGATYTTYTSSSLDAVRVAGQLDQPAGSSRLCLSCHDGTLAIGQVNVRGGQQNVSIAMTGTGAGGVMPAGDGLTTGYTRNLGTDLTNDHPISLTFDTDLAAADGELWDPAGAAHIGVRAPGQRFDVPLEETGALDAAQVQCASCHDPHLVDPEALASIKFLRLNRFQQTDPVDGAFDKTRDMVCLGCHDKEGWATSAHALSAVANETYIPAEADRRDFPPGLPVWQAGCLNCHDTHTVHGSRRLLREGTDSPTIPKQGGNSAIEQTCYQCHGNTPVVNNAANEVKNVQADFNLARRMPITTQDQVATTEVHDIQDADFSETQQNLGRGDLNNRHAECTDCHNPHRVMKNAAFNGGGAAQATHNHAATHSNVASGALRGAWGVEPVYGAAAFLSLPSGYVIKQGDGGLGASPAVGAPWVTREYQVCLKCHSDFGYNDNNVYPEGNRPPLRTAGGGTPPGTNGLNQYTNQAMEFQPAQDQRGNNHRSWHPVIAPTGRTLANRGMGAGSFETPWDGAANVGNQTMYCSDCHGTNTSVTSVVPTGGRPWGPHGSENDFILKGTWTTQTGTGQAANGLCFRCHDFARYTDRTQDANNFSGFCCGGKGNLHAFHADRIGRIRCSWCHVAVPHGWKNKALLVNLNDVGPEAGLPPGTSRNGPYSQGPYYFNAYLKVNTWANSGSWAETNCGEPGNTGKDWMRATCENPP